jgi:hypothetical protein
MFNPEQGFQSCSIPVCGSHHKIKQWTVVGGQSFAASDEGSSEDYQLNFAVCRDWCRH